MRVPFVKSYFTKAENKRWYEDRLYARAGALGPTAVDKAITAQERELLRKLEGGKDKDGGDLGWSDILGRE
jgi:hypothetical protein